MINALNTAIYSKLSAGTALVAALGGTAIYHLQAPDDTALPYIVWSWAGGGQLDRDIHDQVEFVRAYANSAAQAGTIMVEVDALLNNGTLSVSGYSTPWLRREDNYEAVETPPNSAPVYTVGAMYRVILDK